MRREPHAASGRADANDPERSVSVQQLKANISSVVGSADYGNLDGTRSWRLDWWSEIRSYTLHGPYFWSGKGFGVNLADEDGFQVQDDRSLRSPHSIHMSVLARSGVPGLVAWGLLNVGYAWVVLTGQLRARRAGQERWAMWAAFALAYWLALVVNASFDVYLEGPSGGIWFWCVVGFGLVITYLARVERRLIAVGARPDVASESGKR